MMRRGSLKNGRVAAARLVLDSLAYLLVAGLLGAAAVWVGTAIGGEWRPYESSGLYTWWDDGANNGYLYSRHACRGCGRRYCQYQPGYHYVKHSKISDYKKSGWRGELVDVIKAAQEQHDWIESLETLGLDGALSGYGAPATAIAQAGVNVGGVPYIPAAPQGASVYGYSAFTSSYGQTDLASLYNQAGRLTSQAQELAGQANTDFSALVSQEGNNQADVARILASAQALDQVRGQPSPPERRTFSFQVQQQPGGQYTVQRFEARHSKADFDGSGAATQLEASGGGGLDAERLVGLGVIRRDCVSCHGSGDAIRAGLDLTDVARWSDARKDKWRERVEHVMTTDDASQWMPRKPDGSPGARGTLAERVAVVRLFETN